MSNAERPPDFEWNGQPRWKCPDCEYDGISARDVDGHRIVHRHEEAFRRQAEAGGPIDMEAAIREAEKPQKGMPSGPPLFDYANRQIKP